MHATAFLKDSAKPRLGPVAVLFGTERFLKQMSLDAISRRVFGDQADDLGLTRFPGKESELNRVLDELLTVSMFGERRIALVDDADDFVKLNRHGLEKYLEHPAKKSVLILDVKTWTSTTRLAKKVVEIGLDLDCGALKLPDLIRWLGERSVAGHGKRLDREAAQLLCELAGNDMGLLDQELAKLAAYVGDRAKIDAEAVRTLVGGWRAETTWSMLDAVRDGQTGKALQLLDKLLAAGEHPLKLLGGINFSFRGLARATESAALGKPLRDALAQPGVKPFIVEKNERYLRRMGRPRAERIYRWLLEADGDLKGNSSLPDRLTIERLLLRLAGKLE